MQSTTAYKLTITDLNSDSAIEGYKVLLRNNWNNNVYYSYEHLKYYENDSDSLKYFLFKNNDTPIILMPFIFRKVKINGQEIQYFDVISPYGYNGPLFNNIDVSDNAILEFWNSVDKWYKDNNVIAEFIRFSLNGNFKNYSGTLVESLHNIRGKLLDDFENQWTAFLSKVRNNYRKALKSNLEFKIFHKNEITEEKIKIFHKIYVETMKRNNASDIYFFSWEYFKNYILSNLDCFSIALVYYEGIPISTELIINYNDTIFAFLGGTNAEYYKYRPNDFLRVEVIKWAIENKKQYYVLGGGIKDGDGLYKSKKALFPKDEDVIFYTGRKIINLTIYKEIIKQQNINDIDVIVEDITKNYFPIYRTR